MSARSFWYHFSNAAHVNDMVWKSLLLTVFQIFYKALVTTYTLNINFCPYHFCIRRYSTNWDTQHLNCCSNVSSDFLDHKCVYYMHDHNSNLCIVSEENFFNLTDMMPFSCYVWWMPFPEGMQLILVELVLLLKFAVYFFLNGYKSSAFTKFEIALMKIIRKEFELLRYICGFQEMIFL